MTAARRDVEIGRTVLDRPIMALHITPPSYVRPRPAAVLIGAMHGDEPLGVACLGHLWQDLIERPPGRDTWLVPVLDIDGLMGGSKNNARDVDLDRNFASSDWGTDARPGFAPGPEPESEPETRALAGLIERVSAIRVIALGSPARTVAYSGSGLELAQAMAELNGYGASPDPCHPGSLAARYGRDLGYEVVCLQIPFIERERAWAENRSALRFALDLPT